MWLLGRQKLPEGISFHVGQDWICLHRDFVEYAATGTDPLLTGLKEMYRYTMSPVEVIFVYISLRKHAHAIYSNISRL